MEHWSAACASARIVESARLITGAIVLLLLALLRSERIESQLLAFRCTEMMVGQVVSFKNHWSSALNSVDG